MAFQWLDIISLIADVVTFAGLPLLYFSNRQLLNTVRRAHYLNAVGQDSINFARAGDGTGINCVPLTAITAIPRPGDMVLLPGEYVSGINYGGGTYIVESVVFSYISLLTGTSDLPCPAEQARIVVKVRDMHHPV
jgi:hypothetical protein